MRTILIAPTAFKGTLTPIQVASAIEDAAREALGEPLDVMTVPIADGGDGTIECVARILKGGYMRDEQCLGAVGQAQLYQWFKLDTMALVELAACCGIAQLDHADLAPMTANTFGLGQAVARCFEAGCTEINIAVGGSASTDGGMGALKALGAVFFNSAGQEVQELGGAALKSIADIDLTPLRYLTKDTTIRVLTDVDNPLIGESGAAKIFAPQKGATPDQAAALDDALRHFASILERAADSQCRDIPGAGAAGGTAFGLACALGAEITSGFEWIARAADLDERIAAADLVVTGEGRFDSQSLSGKAVGRIIARCERLQKKVLVVSGCVSDDLPDFKHTLVVPEPSSNGRCGRKEIENSIRETLPHFFHD
jgi:glycerate kinase